MLVAETLVAATRRPWSAVPAGLPPPWSGRRYATSNTTRYIKYNIVP